MSVGIKDGWGVYSITNDSFNSHNLITAHADCFAIYETRKKAMEVARQFRGLKVCKVAIIRRRNNA